MPRKAKLSIIDSGHAKQPDFSIPAPDAKHHDAAAQHYEEAARHHRQAAKLYRSAPTTRRPAITPTWRTRTTCKRSAHAEEAAKAHMKIISTILTEAALRVFKGKRGQNDEIEHEGSSQRQAS